MILHRIWNVRNLKVYKYITILVHTTVLKVISALHETREAAINEQLTENLISTRLSTAPTKWVKPPRQK